MVSCEKVHDFPRDVYGGRCRRCGISGPESLEAERNRKTHDAMVAKLFANLDRAMAAKARHVSACEVNPW